MSGRRRDHVVKITSVSRAKGLRAPRRAKVERALAAAAALSGVIIRRAAQLAGPKGKLPAASKLPGGLSVDLVWVADGEMRGLNRRFAGRRGTTDVLAFENSGPGPDTGRHLGEIVCNLELAGREAAARGHTREAEAVLYATHGLVHLLGGRDGTPGDRRRMRRVEIGALRAAGIEVRGGEWEETRQRQRITAKHAKAAKDGIRGGRL